MPTNPKPVRSPSMAKDSSLLMGALVERARIVNVNIRDYTVDITTEFSFKNKFDIPIMTSYCNQINGEGLNFLPEVGATCWICTPSEDGREAFVLGFTMVDEGGSYRGGREILNPGDINFTTRDGNFCSLRRGGVVQIGSTSICQRVFIPIRNVIQDFAENYELHTPSGDLTWKVARKDEDSDGHQMCLFSLATKEFADDPNDKTIGLLRMGSHGQGNDTIFSLLTLDKGGGTSQVTIQIDKSGQLQMTMNKLNVNIQGDLSLVATGKASIQFTGEIDLQTMAALQITASTIALTAGNMQLALSSAGGTVSGPMIFADGKFPALRASPDLLAWMGVVSATLMGATAGLPVLTIGPALIPPSQHMNPKVLI